MLDNVNAYNSALGQAYAILIFERTLSRLTNIIESVSGGAGVVCPKGQARQWTHPCSSSSEEAEVGVSEFEGSLGCIVRLCHTPFSQEGNAQKLFPRVSPQFAEAVDINQP